MTTRVQRDLPAAEPDRVITAVYNADQVSPEKLAAAVSSTDGYNASVRQ